LNKGFKARILLIKEYLRMSEKKGKLIHIDRTQKQVVDILERLSEEQENIKELIVFYMDKEGVYHSLSSDINDEIYLAGILHSMVNNLLYDASEPED
jgi:Tat protein secretion system quality control protein TatD with DNase activity